MPFNFLGLRSLIYPAPDIAASKKWWSEVLGVEPYFDDGGYVGFNLAGYELGLNSWSEELKGSITYIGVDDLDAAVSELQAQGARILLDPMDVGGGIFLADLISPQGEVFGLIFNPHFKLPE